MDRVSVLQVQVVRYLPENLATQKQNRGEQYVQWVYKTTLSTIILCLFVILSLFPETAVSAAFNVV